MKRTRAGLLTVPALIAGLVMALALTAQPSQAGQAASQAPNFKAPFPCGQKWTYSHHSAEVRRALDFIRSDGGTTNGTPNLASAAGTAYNYYEAGGAGNYVVIDHGGGWKTYYFHLSSFSVSHGSPVSQGQQIGTTGSTGNSSGPHIHYEQLYNGAGQNIKINGQSLPYPGSYGQYHLTSDNGCGNDGKYWVDTFAQAEGYNDTQKSDAQGYLHKGTHYVYCKAKGVEVRVGDQYNTWWLKTDLDVTYSGKNGRNAYVSAYYLSRWGNDEARDNSGRVIPTC